LNQFKSARQEAIMLESGTISIAIDRNWKEVYEAVWQPETFPKWASGLSKSVLTREGDAWKAEGPEGEVRIAFTAHNEFGIMDHTVTLQDGSRIYVPMRVIRNGEGTEVQFTLFRLPEMSDEKFAADVAWVTRDLQALKTLFTRR
jgi:hypothetical protein